MNFLFWILFCGLVVNAISVITIRNPFYVFLNLMVLFGQGAALAFFSFHSFSIAVTLVFYGILFSFFCYVVLVKTENQNKPPEKFYHPKILIGSFVLLLGQMTFALYQNFSFFLDQKSLKLQKIPEGEFDSLFFCLSLLIIIPFMIWALTLTPLFHKDLLKKKDFLKAFGAFGKKGVNDGFYSKDAL